MQDTEIYIAINDKQGQLIIDGKVRLINLLFLIITQLDYKNYELRMDEINKEK